MGKLSPINFLSLGLMILGIGCICWAAFSIWTQSDYSADTTNSSYSITTTFASEPNNLTEGSTAPVELGNSSAATPNPATLSSTGVAAGKVNMESEPSSPLPAPDKILYPVYPAEGDNIGSLAIPALKQKLPLFEGTGKKELKKGVGHFIQSVLPGQEDNCVLSGHRDTVFRQIGNLKIGDLLIVQTSAGTFTYAIKGTRIVHADDKTVIVHTDHAALTLTTCYPFNFIGSAPDRYILIADLVISK